MVPARQRLILLDIPIYINSFCEIPAWLWCHVIFKDHQILQLFNCSIFIIKCLSSGECWYRVQGCQFVVTMLKMLLHCGQCCTRKVCSRIICVAANDQARDPHGLICMIETVLISQEASRCTFIVSYFVRRSYSRHPSCLSQWWSDDEQPGPWRTKMCMTWGVWEACAVVRDPMTGLPEWSDNITRTIIISACCD